MGFARFLSSLMATFLPPYDLGVFRFVCFIEIRNKCAINVLQSSLPFSTESPTLPSSSSSSAPSTRINRARSDSLVDPLRRVANVPVLLRPSKALSPRRTSPVDGSPTVSKRSKPSKTYSSRSR